MGGDGMGGLAVAIVAAMVAMVAGGFAIAFVLGRALARRAGAGSGTGWLIAGGIGLAGAALGLLAVTATFFESTWAPPPAIALNLPADYRHETIILLEDPKAAAVLIWRGRELPFMGRSTSLDVPANGVARVQALGPLAGRGDATVKWSDGSTTMGFAGGPAPPSIGASTYAIFYRGAPSDDLAFHDPEKLGAYISAREAGRK